MCEAYPHHAQKSEDRLRPYPWQGHLRGGCDFNEYPQGGLEPLIKLLKSAIANAENNFEMDVDRLYVSEVFVSPGPTMKRIQARARGSADRLLKRSSHITLALKRENKQEVVQWGRKLILMVFASA